MKHAGVAAVHEHLSDVLAVHLEVAKGTPVAVELHDIRSETHPPAAEQLPRELRSLLPEALGRVGVLRRVDEEDADPGAVLELHRVAINHVPDDRFGGRSGSELVVEVPEFSRAVRLLPAACQRQERRSNPRGRSSGAPRPPLIQKFHTAQ